MQVLYYYPWGYFEPISCGADLIASNQLEYFRRRGWNVDVVLPNILARATQADAFHSRYPWLQSVSLIDTPAEKFNFGGKLFVHHRIAASQTFQDLARKGHDLFVTNYVFTAPLVEPLPPTCKKLLEALDIMTDSFAINEQLAHSSRPPMTRARDAFLWNLELELFQLFDSLLFISRQESRVVEPHFPGITHTVPPMMPWETGPHEQITPRCPESHSSDGSFDLIFVGSNAYPNVSGLTFFYDKIFVPYMRTQGVRMAVVGSVCDSLDFDDHQVVKLGKVPGSLHGLYERSKIVVIPILEGSGLSIKTIECLAGGRAVVTTPKGTRGLHDDPESFLQLDMAANPANAAHQILDLLASEPKRIRMQHKAREYYRAHFGADRYFHKMDSIMESIGIAEPAAKAATPHRHIRKHQGSKLAPAAAFSVHVKSLMKEMSR